MIANYPAIHPDGSWTKEEAAAFVSHHDAEVSEAMARLQHRLVAANPHGVVLVHRSTAETIRRYWCTRRGTTEQQMGYVEVKVPTGETYSGTVAVRWDDGSVVTTENPAVPA